MSQFWSKRVHQLKPYQPGEQPASQATLIKLNTNENPFPPSPKALQAIKHASNANLRRYPDPEARELKRVIANYYQLDSNQVFIGNSSDEVLAVAFNAFFADACENKPLLFADITYSFYRVWCAWLGISYQTVALDANFQIKPEDYNIAHSGIIITNPNSPTGISLPAKQIENLLNKHPNTVIIIDEAYADFSEHSVARLIPNHPNLVVIQTLSKSRALAGLRVGFALGQTALTQGLARIKNSFHPYNVNTLSLAGAGAAFEDDDYFQKCRRAICQTREKYQQRLTKLGFEILPSEANFLLVKPPKMSAQDWYIALKEKHIYVRHFSQARICAYLRITIGLDSEMNALLEAIQNILAR